MPHLCLNFWLTQCTLKPFIVCHARAGLRWARCVCDSRYLSQSISRLTPSWKWIRLQRERSCRAQRVLLKSTALHQVWVGPAPQADPRCSTCCRPTMRLEWSIHAAGRGGLAIQLRSRCLTQGVCTADLLGISAGHPHGARAAYGAVSRWRSRLPLHRQLRCCR